MLKLRRQETEPRIELMPLIDVIFLILTFFIYAMVLMVQIDVMPVPMESYVSGTSAEPVPATSITIDLDGGIYRHDFVARAVIEGLMRVQLAWSTALSLGCVQPLQEAATSGGDVSTPGRCMEGWLDPSEKM